MVTGRRRLTGASRAPMLGAIVAVIVALGLAAAPAGTAVAAPSPSTTAAPLTTAPEPKSWIVVDADTGRVLAGHDIHTAYSPASMSKVMTALTSVERLPANTSITITPIAEQRGESNLTPTGMKAGQHWPLDTTIGLLLVASANDAAYSLASRVGGSLEHFAQLETETAHRLGMRDSHFADPAGLDDSSSFGGGPRMSAFDVAISVRAALGVPELAHWAATPQFTYHDPTGAIHTVANHNKLLIPGPNHYEGTIGFKTGFTHLAGNTLAAVARRGNRTIITVVMNTWDPNGWSRELLDRGFQTPPNSRGTGVLLPDAHATAFSQRAADRAAFLALAQGPVIPDSSTVASTATVTTYPGTSTTSLTTSASTSTATSTAPSTTTTTVAAQAIAAQAPPSTTGGSSGGGGGSSWGTIVAIVLVLLVLASIAIVLRRRAVRRRRQRRLARRRQTQAALRRGSLPVVDGRYRPGMRTGNPVESHVKIHRDHDNSGPSPEV